MSAIGSTRSGGIARRSVAELTAAQLRARYPQFLVDTYPDATLELSIAEACELCDVSPAATMACAAHLLVLTAQDGLDADGGSGVVMSETIGPRMVSYAIMAQGSRAERRAFFEQTPYGRRMLALEDRSPGSFGVLVA